MREHLKKHRNIYSLLFLVLVAIMVAWLFISVEKLDIQISKITGNIFSARSQSQITTVKGSVVGPSGPAINRGDVTVSGQTNDLPELDVSVGANIPGGDDAPNDSDDVSADTSSVQVDAEDVPDRPDGSGEDGGEGVEGE